MGEYDFICIGGGLGGLAGAVRARALGLSTVVLEKSPLVGGVAAYSGGDIWAPLNHLARAEGVADSREAAYAYMSYVGGSGVPFSPEVRAAYIDSIAEAVEFYATSANVEFHLGGGGDAFYPYGEGSVAVGRSMDVSVDGVDLGEWYELLREDPYHSSILRGPEAFAATEHPDVMPISEEELAARLERKFMTRGRGLSGGFLKAALSYDIPIHVNVDVRSLIYDGSRVQGVVAQIDGKVEELQARKGVLIATGGYGQASYAKDLEGLPEYFEQAPPIVDGDAFTLVEPTPAAVIRAGFGYVTLAFKSSTQVHPATDVPLMHPMLDSLSHPHIIAVNPDAKRFGDESVYVTFANAIGAYDTVRKRYQNFPTYAICDDQFRLAGYEFGRSTKEWPEREIVRGDTIAELAEKLGLDPVVLEETIGRFNEYCESGVDEEFHRGEVLSANHWGDARFANPNLGTIEKAPFWGCRCSIVGAGINSHGLSIDANANVLTLRGAPIPGLYATGNAVAYVEVPGGYQSGIANGRNMTYAYLAATHAGRQ